ncbi:MAG: SUMF1/EgtB/PvdO family nonheme iron enzyme, partial [Nitrospinae bacterium]|nr:SUMF1/EgtB/PvdO family nonheme iron enzyme [Nitrospinota bacterium]
EWTASDYEGKTGHKVSRGGAWSYNPISARPAYRLPYDPDRRFDSIGFRCAR